MAQAKKDIEFRAKQLLLDEFEKSEKSKAQDVSTLTARKSAIQEELRQYLLKLGKLVLASNGEIH